MSKDYRTLLPPMFNDQLPSQTREWLGLPPKLDVPVAEAEHPKWNDVKPKRVRVRGRNKVPMPDDRHPHKVTKDKLSEVEMSRHGQWTPAEMRAMDDKFCIRVRNSRDWTEHQQTLLSALRG